jgi:hypothetical protein
LLRALEAEAQRQLQLFKNAEDAYEKRGYANAVTELRALMQSLYSERSDHIGQELETADSIIEGASNGQRRPEQSEPEPEFHY